MAVKKVQVVSLDSARATKLALPVVHLSLPELKLARENAELCSFGGISRLRSKAEREETCSDDNLTGQVCELAFSKYWFGSIEPYRQARWIRNQNPKQGDGGYDYPAMTMNVKGSLRRDVKRPFEKYHLLVRPKERKSWATYIQAVADLSLTDDPFVVFLGFLTDAEIVGKVDEGWHFQGAHAIPFSDLHRLPPYSWKW